MGGLPKTFWYLWTGTLINRSGAFVMLFLEINMVVKYHFSATFAGLTLGLFGGGLALGSLLGGILTDRWGRRGTLLLSSTLQAATAVVLGTTFNQLWIAVLATILGFWNGLGRPAFNATMVDVLGPSLRMRGMNLNYWAINLGFSAAAILAGVLSHAPHMTVFVLNAAAQLIMALIVFALVPETMPGSARASRQECGQPETTVRIGSAPVAQGSMLTVLKDRTFMTFVLLNLGLWTIIEGCRLIPIAMNQRGLDATDYGAVIAVNGIMIVLLQLFVPRLIKGRKRTHVLAVAAILVGVGMGAVAIAGSVFALMLTVLVWTAGEMINAPVSGAYIADLSQAEMRGRYQGVASMSFTIANFVSPIFGGILLDYAPGPTLWLIFAGIGVIVAVGQIITGPARERRVAYLNQEGAKLAAVAG